MPDTADRIVARLVSELRARENAENVAGMARFGIAGTGRLGVSLSDIRAIARGSKPDIGRDLDLAHHVALQLWATAIPEARLLATIVDAPSLLTFDQADAWARDIESWDLCDGLCGNLLWRTDFAWDLPYSWSGREETFVKRAGFVMAAQLAVKDKAAAAERFIELLRLVEREAGDERNDVKKGVNWALRQIGKRNAVCHAAAVSTATRLAERQAESRSARWIARDALRELESDAVRRRVGAV